MVASGTSSQNNPGARIADMMATAWRPPGFCVPNNDVYPHQWLWDSCFHALVWAEIDPARAVRELWSALAKQDRSGFVPHMSYWSEPDAGAEFWGRTETSTITQPPMYGHAAAALVRRAIPMKVSGVDPVVLIDRVIAGLQHLLLERRRSPAGLICVFHPWESGCDDSPRWPGANMAAGQWASGGLQDWRGQKGQMVTELVFDDGAPVNSPRFVVGSVGFSALVAWNALEVAEVLADHPGAAQLATSAADLVTVIAQRWSNKQVTWIDDPVHALDLGAEELAAAAQVRTSDALLALLVDPRPEAFNELVDPAAFGGAFGPTGVHRQEPSFDAAVYWRGPAWPQMSYLLWVAADRAGHVEIAEQLRLALIAGAEVSGYSEFWSADTGEGYGASPQTWAGLALVANAR